MKVTQGLRSSVQPWRPFAACAGHPDPGAWNTDDVERVAVAVRTCLACPVWRDCLTFALDTGDRFGVSAAFVEGSYRSAGRKLWRSRLRRGEVTLDHVLDEHEATLDPTGDDEVPRAFARVVPGARRGGLTRAGVVALWRTSTAAEAPAEVARVGVP